MADPRGFLTTPRRTAGRRPADVRIMDWKEVYTQFSATELERQAGRCMDCGIPFCHQGCPLGNLIPEWNDLVRTGNWRAAAERDRKSTRLNSSHVEISYAVFCLKKKKK